VLAANLLVSLLALVLGGTTAYAVGGISVDQSVNALGATSFTIGTTQPNELILVAADGYPCVGGQTVTVDGSAATLVTTAGCDGNTGGATVFQFVAASPGIHNVAVGEGNFSGLRLNFGVSLLNATATGLTSAAFNGGSPSITTTAANEYVFANSEYNTGTTSGTLAWSGSPVTPTFLQGGNYCDGGFCGIDASIAGLGAPTAGMYSASMSDSNQFPGIPGLTILVAVQPKAAPSLTTTPSTTSVTIGPSPTTFNDTALLSGGDSPTGTITFTLYHGATLVDTETASVSGNSSYTTPTGYTLPSTGTVSGIYQWDATYNGDGNNTSASDNGATNEQVTVVSPCGTGLTPYFLTATYHTGTFTGVFCVNANGDGTYTQNSPGLPVSQRTLTGTGHIRMNQGVTSIQAYMPAFQNLNLVGTTNGTASSFGESGSGFPHLNGTFTLTKGAV
jgi:hypothetical protein